MKLTVRLPGNATRAQADQIAQAIAALVVGASVVVVDEAELPAALSDPRLALKQLEDTSRLIVATWLGQHVATVGPLEAAMCMTLHECRGVFPGSKELFAALEATWPAWKGQRHQTRQVYSHLKKKLAPTRYPLVGTRGRYGFAARADVGSASVDLFVVEPKTG